MNYGVSLAVVLVLSGCTSLAPRCMPERPTPSPEGTIQIKWVKLDYPLLVRECGRDATACFRVEGNMCVVYTRKPVPNEPMLTLTILADKLHEADHCLRGHWHK